MKMALWTATALCLLTITAMILRVVIVDLSDRDRNEDER